MKTTIRLFISSFAFCLLSVVTPKAPAVVPPPDGGYPNFNTAEGQNALFSLTSGAANTAVGWFSLHTVTTGNFNTGLGAGALVLNTGDENTAIGAAALLLNTASGNTAVGSRALVNNTTGGTLGNTQGFDFGPNVAVGQGALEHNTVASANTAVGYQALNSFTTGPRERSRSVPARLWVFKRSLTPPALEWPTLDWVMRLSRTTPTAAATLLLVSKLF